MNNNLPGIDYKKSKSNPTIESKTSFFDLPFYKDVEYFSNLDNFVNFIKAVEKLVRTSIHYDRYKKYIMEDINLKRCQVLSNITEEDATLEMHHGPVLTLFDCASIITDSLLSRGKKITTFIVADILLEEHYNNNIQVTMLSKTVHQEVHDRNIFISTKQAFGDLNRFIRKYKDGLHDDQKFKINRYIELCEKHESFDKGVLTLRENIAKWSKEDII